MRCLITGGTGSLGHALVRRYVALGAERIVVYSRDEYKQSQMAERFSDPSLRFFIGDVRDRDRLCEAMWGIDTVIHAAALKRVDAVAYHATETLKTNVLGTQAVIQAAVLSGVKRVVLISSDKAVAPANSYGASKMYAEHLAITSNSYSYPRGTRVSAVRYGNVAWSRGSVLWAWEKLAQDRHFLITDKRMTRFWLTMDQAVDTIEYCLANMEGGEVYIPRCKAAALVDIAHAMVHGDCVLEETGLRPGGEKLHETLLGIEEIDRACEFMEYFCLYPHLATWRPMEPLPFNVAEAYSSNTAPKMSQEEIMSLLASRPV